MGKNIFIEGMQGTGKSTLLHELSKNLPDYKVYREGDLSPVELAWCSHMKIEDFQEILDTYPANKADIMEKTMVEGEYYITAYTQVLTDEPEFYKRMETHEIYNARRDFESFRSIIKRRYENFSFTDNLFECSLLQNSIECMLLYYEMSDEKIMDFYRDMYQLLREKNVWLIYLDSTDIEKNILQIKQERTDHKGNELWFPLMMNYLKESPYGKHHNYENISHMIEHFNRRRNLELRIVNEIFQDQAIVVHAKQYQLEDIIVQIEQSDRAVR